MSTINIQQKKFLGSLSLLLFRQFLYGTDGLNRCRRSLRVGYVRFDTTPVNYEALEGSERFLLPSDTANKWRLNVEVLNWNVKRSDLDFAEVATRQRLRSDVERSSSQFDENQGFAVS